MQQLLPFALHQPGHRDAGPALDDAGHLFIGDLIPQQGTLPVLGGVGQLFLFGQLLLQGRQLAVLQFGRLV